MVRADVNVTLSVLNHPSVAKGTLRTLIARGDLTVDEFIEADHEC